MHNRSRCYTFIYFALISRQFKVRTKEIGLSNGSSYTYGFDPRNCDRLSRFNFKVGGENLKIDLAVLDIQDFDVVIGMDFLSIHEAKVYCKNKTVSLLQPSGRWVIFQGQNSKGKGKHSMTLLAL